MSDDELDCRLDEELVSMAEVRSAVREEAALLMAEVSSLVAERDALRAQLATCAAELLAARQTHPAAQQLPAPTGDGADVHAWLMMHLDGAGLRPDTFAELEDALWVCAVCGWDLREALEARHAFGVKKWGDTLRTRDGQDSLQAWGQERLDGLMYRAKWQMEGEGL